MTIPPGGFDLEKFTKFLDDKQTYPECSYCGENKFSASEKVVEMREYRGGNVVTGGLTMAFVPLVCLNCGNTFFFNARVARVEK